MTAFRRQVIPAAALFLLVFSAFSCLKLPRPGVDGPAGFHDLVIRARKQVDGRLKGGRVMLKIQEQQGLVLFLTPLNQVALKLEVSSGGQAALFNPKTRGFWKGAMSRMMTEMWNLPLDWSDLIALLLHGRMPRGREDLGEWRVLRTSKEGWLEGELNGPYGVWRFTVLRRNFVQEPLPARQGLEGWTEVTLEELFK